MVKMMKAAITMMALGFGAAAALDDTTSGTLNLGPGTDTFEIKSMNKKTCNANWRLTLDECKEAAEAAAGSTFKQISSKKHPKHCSMSKDMQFVYWNTKKLEKASQCSTTNVKSAGCICKVRIPQVPCTCQDGVKDESEKCYFKAGVRHVSDRFIKSRQACLSCTNDKSVYPFVYVRTPIGDGPRSKCERKQIGCSCDNGVVVEGAKCDERTDGRFEQSCASCPNDNSASPFVYELRGSKCKHKKTACSCDNGVPDESVTCNERTDKQVQRCTSCNDGFIGPKCKEFCHPSNCKWWECDGWCKCFDESKSANFYAHNGCADDGQDTCFC